MSPSTVPGLSQVWWISGLIAFGAMREYCGGLNASLGVSGVCLGLLEAMDPVSPPPTSEKHRFISFTSASAPHPNYSVLFPRRPYASTVEIAYAHGLPLWSGLFSLLGMVVQIRFLSSIRVSDPFYKITKKSCKVRKFKGNHVRALWLGSLVTQKCVFFLLQLRELRLMYRLVPLFKKRSLVVKIYVIFKNKG